MNYKIHHDEKNHRFYSEIDGKTSELKYKKRGNQILEYYSTYVPEPLRNHGIAGKITQYALEYAKKNDYHIIPSCSFVKSYLDSHPDYADLVKK